MTYLRPEGLGEALEALARPSPPRIIAGCTDLLAATEAQTLGGEVLDITAIEELRTIGQNARGWEIGAAVTWSEIARADLPAPFRALQQAARVIGAAQIQNRGTLGGNLCNASPAADGVPPLLVLDAQVELRSARARRVLPLGDFITGVRRTVLAPGEILTRILLPTRSCRGESGFLKLGARDSLVISIAMAAARFEIAQGVVRQAAIAVGACGPLAARLEEAEARLIGHPPDPARLDDALIAAALAPIDDIRADAAYRKHAAGELVRRLVAEAGVAA